MPKKDIDAAESEVASLKGRLAAVGGGLSGREALVAPVGGVLAASNAVVGQVVEPKELIFEVIDPDSLHIEATAFDPIPLDQIASATVAVGDQAVPLSYVGAPRRLREQALPLIFENHAAGAGLALPLGQPVKVQVSLKATAQGLPLPAQRADAQHGQSGRGVGEDGARSVLPRGRSAASRWMACACWSPAACKPATGWWCRAPA